MFKTAFISAQGVAPFAGAWIEIFEKLEVNELLESLPSRERGLKSMMIMDIQTIKIVAPFAGAWIEIYKNR